MIRPIPVVLVALSVSALCGCPEGARQEQWTPEKDAMRPGAPTVFPEVAPPPHLGGADEHAVHVSGSAPPVDTALPLGMMGGAEGTRTPELAPPTLKIEAPKASGGLTNAAVEPVLTENLGRFRVCYAKATREDPYVDAAPAFSFSVPADGRVKSADVKVKALGELAAVEDCLKNAVHAIELPKPEGGAAKLEFVVSFHAGEADGTIAGKHLEDVAAGDIDQVLTAAGYTVGVSKSKSARGLQRITVEKGEEKYGLAFVPYRVDKPMSDEPELDKLADYTVVHLYDGGRFALGAKAKDRASAKQLLALIIKSPAL